MIYRPGDPARTRHLLAALATPPDPALHTTWAYGLRAVTASVHATVTPDASAHDTGALAYATLYCWRSDLDRHLAAAEHDAPAL